MQLTENTIRKIENLLETDYPGLTKGRNDVERKRVASAMLQARNKAKNALGGAGQAIGNKSPLVKSTEIKFKNDAARKQLGFAKKLYGRGVQ
jgi:hypothetical protein